MVRSRYNVVFSEVPKLEHQFTDHARVHASGEGGYGSASGKYVAVHLAKAGGQVSILDLNNPKRCGRNDPVLDVHKGKVMDSQWSPFNQNMIATASDDATIKLSLIPDPADFTETITEALQEMKGHQKKVMLIDWNMSAPNVLASVSLDKSCKLWDVESGQCTNTLQLTDSYQFSSVKWSYDGSRLATTCKDGIMRLWDPRTPPAEVQEVPGLPLKMVNKAFWAGNLPFVGTLGADRSKKRTLNLWDVSNLSQPVLSVKPGSTSSTPSVAIPYFDADTNMLYYFGKGESTVWFGEIMTDKTIQVVPAGVARLKTPMKGGCWVPKHAMKTWVKGGCEVQRFMKFEDGAIVPHSFVFPKRTEVYHADVYPDTFMGQPALTKDEWFGGQNAAPVLGSMDPEKRSQGDSAGVVFEKKASYAELEAENEALRARVAELEAQLAQ